MPDKLDLSGVKPVRPMSESDVTKAYIESMIMLPAILQAVIEQLGDIADSLSVVALYCEKRGINEALFTDADLTDDKDDGDGTDDGK